jgi:hypothetical protein
MNKRNAILLSLLAILFIIFMVSKGRENLEVRKDLYSFHRADIHRVEIVQHADTLIVCRESGDWRIIYPRALAIKDSQLDKFFSALLSVTHSTVPISSSAEQRNFYHVCDDTANKITLYGAGNRKLKKVYFGRGHNPQIANIRVENEDDIYQIESIFTAINPSISVWRDDMIISVPPDAIETIAISSGDTIFRLISQGAFWTLSIGDTQEIVSPNNPELQRLLNALANLSTNAFFDDEFPEHAHKLQSPVFEMLIVLRSGENVYIRCAENDESSYILQKNDEQDTLYRLTTQRFNQLNIDPSKLLQET